MFVAWLAFACLPSGRASTQASSAICRTRTQARPLSGHVLKPDPAPAPRRCSWLMWLAPSLRCRLLRAAVGVGDGLRRLEQAAIDRLCAGELLLRLAELHVLRGLLLLRLLQLLLPRFELLAELRDIGGAERNAIASDIGVD